MSKEELKKISNDYIHEWIAGGEPADLDGSADAPLELILAIQELKDFLQPLAPRPWSTQSMSATPGAFVPVLRAILEEYEREHAAAENTMKPTPTLPKLFALTPVPTLKQRFIAVNGKALRVLLNDNSESDSYEGHCSLFQKVFDMDNYRFFRYGFRMEYTISFINVPF